MVHTTFLFSRQFALSPPDPKLNETARFSWFVVLPCATPLLIVIYCHLSPLVFLNYNSTWRSTSIASSTIRNNVEG